MMCLLHVEIKLRVGSTFDEEVPSKHIKLFKRKQNLLKK
jgi:hypothetical protein